MREIGGYFELDMYQLPMLHENALKFNCGRNCLAYLIEKRNIKKILLPYYICDSVTDICKKYKLDIAYYHIDSNFIPKDIEFDDESYLYIVNYFGQLTYKQKKELKHKYKKIIIDNTQAYFDKPLKNCDNLYSSRKYFGVPDGALLYTNVIGNYNNLENEVVFDRMGHILGRYEKNASDFYKLFVENDEKFCNSSIKKMSKITENLLHAIDYKTVKCIRNRNYEYLYSKLKEINKLKLKKISGAYCYPLYIENADAMRNKMIKNKIYVPTLWPNVINDLGEETLEYKFAKNILPLPCDQRYTIEDMQKIIKIIIDSM